MNNHEIFTDMLNPKTRSMRAMRLWNGISERKERDFSYDE